MFLSRTVEFPDLLLSLNSLEMTFFLAQQMVGDSLFLEKFVHFGWGKVDVLSANMIYIRLETQKKH